MLYCRCAVLVLKLFWCQPETSLEYSWRLKWLLGYDFHALCHIHVARISLCLRDRLCKMSVKSNQIKLYPPKPFTVIYQTKNVSLHFHTFNIQNTLFIRIHTCTWCGRPVKKYLVFSQELNTCRRGHRQTYTRRHPGAWSIQLQSLNKITRRFFGKMSPYSAFMLLETAQLSPIKAHTLINNKS